MHDLNGLVRTLIDVSGDDNPDVVMAAVMALCDALRAHPDQVQLLDLAVLQALRRGRQFAALRLLTEALNGLGHTDPAIRLALAQALIDTEAPSTAIDVLRRIRDQADIPPAARIEAHGLTGRAFKDLFLTTGSGERQRRTDLLAFAMENYETAFRDSGEKSFWAGENLLGLIDKARRLGLSASGNLDADALSGKLKHMIEHTPPEDRSYWQWATLALMEIGQQNWPAANRLLARAVAHSDVSAFALAGTVRQLKDVWDIDQRGEEGAGLLVTLQARQLQLAKGQVTLSPKQMQVARSIPESQFEKIFGAEGPKTRAWMQKFMDVGESVGLISQRFGQGMGTCFIVEGGLFHPSLAGERLVLTNDHVISPEPERYQSAPPLRVEKADVSFEVFSKRSGETRIPAHEIVWSSGPLDHDACLIRLRSPLPDALPALMESAYVPIVDETAPEGIYVIGHPGGRGLSYSMQNNELLDHDCHSPAAQADPRRIHYVTPTEPGSSGSPAMNADLDVIGLHHAGAKYMSRLNGAEGTYPANEAIWLTSICRAAHDDLDAGRVRWKR